MTQPELVLDLSANGLSLWQPLEARDWVLLGFSQLDDPEIGEKVRQMQQAARAAAGTDFALALLMPDDQVWVQRLLLAGTRRTEKLADALRQLAGLTGLPAAEFSVDLGDTDADGRTAVAATTLTVLNDARKFVAGHGFDPQNITSRSFFDGFDARAQFDRAPLAMPEPVADAPEPKRQFRRPAWLMMPQIPPKLLAGAAAVALAAALALYWTIDPFEQFVRPPGEVAAVPGIDGPETPVIPANLPGPLTTFAAAHTAAPLTVEPWQPVVQLADTSSTATAGNALIRLETASLGDVFAQTQLAPAAPPGLGPNLVWSAAQARFPEQPAAERSFGVAVLLDPPVLEHSADLPDASGFLANVTLLAVSTRSATALENAMPETHQALALGLLASDFAYRDGAGIASESAMTDVTAIALLPDLIAPSGAQTAAPIRLAALAGPDSPEAIVSDIPIAAPQTARSFPGTRPLPRPAALEIILPSEAAAALTPAAGTPLATDPVFGPEWPGRTPADAAGLVTEFAPGTPGHVRPNPRPLPTATGPALVLADRPVFGPEWTGPLPGPLPGGAVEFVGSEPGHIRPVPRPAGLAAAAALAGASASLIAFNLPDNATLDVGLGWQEYNPDNSAHIRPKTRPASLQQLAEAGDLAPTALALAESRRPAPRPPSIDAIILARSDEIARAQAMAAEAEARAQAVAQAAAIVQAETAALAEAENPQSGAVQTEIDPDLAALDDAEPESDARFASLPTTANVAETATIENGLDRNKTSLIGIYGTESKRRALIRLPSGRYERVTVGDTFSGWKVAAIGKDAIKLVKGGKEAILRMPD